MEKQRHILAGLVNQFYKKIKTNSDNSDFRLLKKGIIGLKVEH
jgi:hypothetical protein